MRLHPKNKRKTGADIKFQDDCVVKHFDRNLRIEYKKADAIHQIGQLRGFDAPKPLKVCNGDNSIIFSRIYNYRSIRTTYLDYLKRRVGQVKNFEEFFEAGRVLACIHNHLSLPNHTHWRPGKLFATAFRELGKDLDAALEGTPQACLHCDYGFSNVNIHPDTKKLAIFDPSANGFVTQRTADFGTIYIDIGNFLSCIEGLIPLRQQIGVDWRLLTPIKEAFLSGYEQEADCDISRELASFFAYATARCYFSYKYEWPILGRMAMNVLYNSWKKNKLVLRDYKSMSLT
jgi:hypothetical protein